MGIRTRNTRIIRITDNIGIKYEEMSDFSDSFFMDVYYEAFLNTQKLIRQSAGFEQKDRWASEQVHNIVSFWGSRGTGKTSAMRSFLGALDKVNEDNYHDFYETFDENSRKNLMNAKEFSEYNFLCLDCIEASLLNSKESICEVILSKMLEIFQQKLNSSVNGGYRSDSYREFVTSGRAEVLSLFEKVHDTLNRTDTDSRAGMSYVELLGRMSQTQELRKNINELVESFLEIMYRNRNGKYEKEKQFLVIAIDDLDMNRESGYEMLEELHRFFMLPNVLIYLTLSGEEVLTLCYNKFLNENESVNVNIAEWGKEEPLVAIQKQLTKSYMEKVLPFSHRVYMPSFSMGVRDIVIGEDDPNKPNYKNIKEWSLKEIAILTGVYFDGCGLKTHFYEPKDLRVLTNLNAMFKEMLPLDIDEMQGMDIDAFETNIGKLVEDICNRLSVEKLNDMNLQEFTRICKMNLSRQGLEITRKFLLEIGEGKFSDDCKWFTYSYGELLRGCYTFGREKSEQKTLVHCVLALESALLTKKYYQTCNNNKDEEKYKKSIEEFSRCMAGSISGSWGNKLVPMLKPKQGLVEGIGWGYNKGSNPKTKFKIELAEEAGNLVECLKIFKKKKLVIALEVLSLFISKDNVQVKISEDTISDKKYLLFNIDNDDIKIDILGFVLKSMNYSKYLTRMDETIARALSEFWGEQLEPIIEDEIGRTYWFEDSKNLCDNFKNWEKKYGFAALPVYSTDIIYNVLKRAKKKCQEESSEMIEKKDIFKYLKKMLINIEQLLALEDEFYKDLPENKRTNFKEAFVNNPVVELIRTSDFETVFKDIFETFVSECVNFIGVLARSEIVYEDFEL